MKTKLLLAALIAAVTIAATAQLVDDRRVKLAGSVEPEQAFANTGAPVIEISGVPHHRIYSTDDAALWLPQYERPASPADVKITIYTADGRKWAARWEEIK